MAEQPPQKPATPTRAPQAARSMEAASQEKVPHHDSPRKRRQGQDPGDMDLNLTSMIDVTFQLLIYFIITAAFSAGEGVLTAKFPQGTGGKPSDEKPPDRPLKIRVRSAGAAGEKYSLQIDGIDAPANFKALAATLAKIQHNPAKNRSGQYKPDNPVVIAPTYSARWAHVVNAFNAAVKAGYSNVAFAQAEADG